jgi:hypothetical protein
MKTAGVSGAPITQALAVEAGLKYWTVRIGRFSRQYAKGAARRGFPSAQMAPGTQELLRSPTTLRSSKTSPRPFYYNQILKRRVEIIHMERTRLEQGN